MILKKIGIAVTLLLAMGASNLFAQSIAEIKANRDMYLWGEGMGETLKSADQAALAEISSQISVDVISGTESTSEEDTKGFSQTFKDVIKTYTNSTLKNTERIILQNEPDAKVFRYIKRDELFKIFESRKNKIVEFARSGESAQKGLQIADALRYYYWAQTLLRSHPDANNIKMTDANGNDVLLIVWLPKQMNDIFSNLTFNVSKIEDNESYLNYILNIRYKSQPVSNMDYTYWGGQDWSNVFSAKDGLGVVELPKSQLGADIRLKIEYVFEGEANIDLELRDVMQKVPQVLYKSCYTTFSSKELPEEKAKVPTAEPILAVSDAENTVSTNTSTTLQNVSPEVVPTNPSSLGNIQQLTDIKNLELTMTKVRQSIMQKKYAQAESCFTPEGYAIYQKLLEYGNAKIVRNNTLNYYAFGDFVICRTLPMSFSFKSNSRTFIEDIIFYFNKENKICNLTFGLGNDAVNDIASHNTWTEANRMLIMSFLENYKTAYALKRLDYIGSIFSDDALIITGYMAKANNNPENSYLNNSIIKYNRQTKSEYMKKLKYSFDSNEFINIRFANNTIRRSGKGNEIYGIQIRQDYFSTNYGDMGYLFLLVDLSDQAKPLIHVRTWQPEKNPDGSIIGISDF